MKNLLEIKKPSKCVVFFLFVCLSLQFELYFVYHR